MNRKEDCIEMLKTACSQHGTTTDQWVVNLLTDIALSLASIADSLEEIKGQSDGSN